VKHVYIDLGAYDGDSIKKFMRMRNLPVKPSQFEIFAFEPNRNLYTLLSKLAYPNLSTLSSAAWVRDEMREFAVDTTATPMGSTLMAGKVSIWDHFKKVQIQCFDFSEWIKVFKDDYLIVKMDIEGAEFPILEKLITDGTDKYINQLWVEMHPNKVKEYTTADADNLLGRLNCGSVRRWA